MSREVPDHVDVVLEEPEVDPHTVHVVELAQFAGVEDLLDAAHDVAEQIGMVDHQHTTVPGGQLDQCPSLGDARCQGLLDQDMQPSVQTASASGKWVETGVAIATASRWSPGVRRATPRASDEGSCGRSPPAERGSLRRPR